MSKVNSVSKTLLSAANEHTGKFQILKTTEGGDLKVSVVHDGDDDGEANAPNQVKIIKNLSIDNTETDGTGIGKFIGDAKGNIADVLGGTQDTQRVISMALENDGGANRGLPHVLSTNASIVQGLADVSGTYAKTAGANTWTALNITGAGDLNVADSSTSAVLGSTNLISTANSDNRLKVEQPQGAFIHSDGELACPHTALKGWTDEATAPYTRSLRCSEKGQLHSQLLGLTNISDQTTHQYVKVEGDGSLNTKDTNLATVLGSASLIDSGNLKTTNANITKGKDATAVGAELQQVLIYGKKDDGTLQPLECLGDRLLVDVLELAASGKITTSTALSSVQVCGFDSNTNQFKTVDVDSNGKLSVNTGLTQNATTTPAESTEAQLVYLGIHDDANNVIRTAKSNAVGELIVSDQAGRFGMTSGATTNEALTGGITETKKVILAGVDIPNAPTAINSVAVGSQGFISTDPQNQSLAPTDAGQFPIPIGGSYHHRVALTGYDDPTSVSQINGVKVDAGGRLNNLAFGQYLNSDPSLSNLDFHSLTLKSDGRLRTQSNIAMTNITQSITTATTNHNLATTENFIPKENTPSGANNWGWFDCNSTSYNLVHYFLEIPNSANNNVFSGFGTLSLTSFIDKDNIPIIDLTTGTTPNEFFIVEFAFAGTPFDTSGSTIVLNEHRISKQRMIVYNSSIENVFRGRISDLKPLDRYMMPIYRALGSSIGSAPVQNYAFGIRQQ